MITSENDEITEINYSKCYSVDISSKKSRLTKISEMFGKGSDSATRCL